MPRSLRSETTIAAPPERVWEILTDFGSFKSWNPFIRRARGELRPGARLDIYLRIYGRNLTHFRPTVTAATAPRELRWHATLGLPGIMDVDRFFLLEATEGGGTRFRQGEDCSGMLAMPLLAAGLESRILKGYRRLNKALKARAERVTPDPTQPSTIPTNI
jgi:hypothetical protein